MRRFRVSRLPLAVMRELSAECQCLPSTVCESDLYEVATSGGFLNSWIFVGNGAFENHSRRLHVAAKSLWLTYIEPLSTCNLTVPAFTCHDSPSFVGTRSRVSNATQYARSMVLLLTPSCAAICSQESCAMPRRTSTKRQSTSRRA